MANQIKANLLRLLFSTRTINSGKWGMGEFLILNFEFLIEDMGEWVNSKTLLAVFTGMKGMKVSVKPLKQLDADKV